MHLSYWSVALFTLEDLLHFTVVFGYILSEIKREIGHYMFLKDRLWLT